MASCFTPRHFGHRHGLIKTAVPQPRCVSGSSAVYCASCTSKSAPRQLHLQVDFAAMLDIRANNQHLAAALNPKTIRAARVIVPATGDFGFDIVNGREVFAGLFNLQKFKLSAHPVQLHRKVLSLHGDLEDFPQIADGLVPAKREKGDFLVGIFSFIPNSTDGSVAAASVEKKPSTRAIPDRDVFYVADPVSSVQHETIPSEE